MMVIVGQERFLFIAMPTTIIKDIIAANEGNQPEAFQFLTEPEPEISWFDHLFAIDLRALAALRIWLGTMVLLFIFNQIGSIDLLYTDKGILPRSLGRQLLGDGFWSLLWFDGPVGDIRIILIATGVMAGAYALGYQTKLINLLLLVLLWSIQIRNPLILTGGDVLLRMLLFWTLFLPVNKVWSIDASQSENKNDRWKIANIATMAIMFQIVFMYFFTGVAKLNAFWLNGDAIQYAMNLEMSVKPLGRWLAGYPKLMYFGTIATLFAEIMTLFLMFIPRVNLFNRGMLLGFFLMMHVGIWLTLSIGLFSLTAIGAWLIFVPSDVFNTFFGQPVGFDEKRFYRSPFELAGRIANIMAAVFLVYITLQNSLLVFLPPQSLATLQLFGRATMTIQQFHMFAKPPLFSPWFEYNAQLDSGERVDIFYPERGNTVVKPESVYSYMQNQNWRRIHWNLITHPLYPPATELVYREIRQRVLLAIVKRWDRQNLEDPVFKAKLLCHLEPIKIGDETDTPKFTNHQYHDLTWAIYESGGESE